MLQEIFIIYVIIGFVTIILPNVFLRSQRKY
jgi:hypothetical protein